jgi:hypothetical protein
MDSLQLKRLKELEEEDRTLKQMFADVSLDNKYNPPHSLDHLGGFLSYMFGGAYTLTLRADTYNYPRARIRPGANFIFQASRAVRPVKPGHFFRHSQTFASACGRGALFEAYAVVFDVYSPKMR